MSAARMADVLGPERQVQFRRWWADNQHLRDHEHLLADYLTPEQRADFAEYGGFAFVTERGDIKYTLAIGHHAGACLRPLPGVPTGIPWMLAVKLLWQADQAGVERTMGREGAHLP